MQIPTAVLVLLPRPLPLPLLLLSPKLVQIRRLPCLQKLMP